LGQPPQVEKVTQVEEESSLVIDYFGGTQLMAHLAVCSFY